MTERRSAFAVQYRCRCRRRLHPSLYNESTIPPVSRHHSPPIYLSVRPHPFHFPLCVLTTVSSCHARGAHAVRVECRPWSGGEDASNTSRSGSRPLRRSVSYVLWPPKPNCPAHIQSLDLASHETRLDGGAEPTHHSPHRGTKTLQCSRYDREHGPSPHVRGRRRRALVSSYPAVSAARGKTLLRQRAR